MKGVKVPPKYRGPGGETWAGRGATPRWLAALIKEGHSIEEFLIGSGRESEVGSREESSGEEERHEAHAQGAAAQAESGERSVCAGRVVKGAEIVPAATRGAAGLFLSFG